MVWSCVAALGDRDKLVDIMREQVVEGKRFSCSCHTDLVLVNGSQGSLILLDVREEVMVVGRGELPDMKQRWFTVACKWGQVWVVGTGVGCT